MIPVLEWLSNKTVGEQKFMDKEGKRENVSLMRRQARERDVMPCGESGSCRPSLWPPLTHAARVAAGKVRTPSRQPRPCLLSSSRALC